MSSKTTIPSLWPKEESSDTILSTSTYISVDEYMRPPDGQPQIERFVRLMSLDNNESCQSPSNVEYEDLTGTCSQYWDIISFSENFVDDIIYEAEALVNKHIKISIHSTGTTERVFVPRYSGEYPVIEYNRPKFTGWPTIREFTIELGAEKIDEYLASFNTNEEWLYIIYYVGLKTENTSEFYEYQAIWSLPSPEYPIPQATASVFFTIEVSNVLPIDCLVDVTFSFEGHRFKHKPGITDFSEEFLNYVLDSKIGVFKKIKF